MFYKESTVPVIEIILMKVTWQLARLGYKSADFGIFWYFISIKQQLDVIGSSFLQTCVIRWWIGTWGASKLITAWL